MKPAAVDLRVAGLVRLSTCDWPGQLSATIFCQGCGWNCPYCHNPALRPAHGPEHIAWEEIRNFLTARVRLLDAVVFSGGEPTLQPALLPAMEEVRRMGFRVGLHTAGPSPRWLAPLTPLLHWVGFDVKAPFAEYARITGVRDSGTEARASLQLLLDAGIEVEARTTVHAALLNANDLITMREELLALGVQHYVVQQFRAAGVDPTAGAEQEKLLQFPPPPMPALGEDFGRGFSSFQVR